MKTITAADFKVGATTSLRGSGACSWRTPRKPETMSASEVVERYKELGASSRHSEASRPSI